MNLNDLKPFKSQQSRKRHGCSAQFRVQFLNKIVYSQYSALFSLFSGKDVAQVLIGINNNKNLESHIEEHVERSKR